jgi:hypothetical protein
MAYLLDFPPSALPDDIRKPPFVMFAINGTSIRALLPRFIPLAAVLHFAPTLRDFVLPTPTNLPPTVAQGVLATPFIGLDIGLDVGAASIQRIVVKIMQSAGFTVPQHIYQHPPSLTTSISILHTWNLLELPPSGLDNLVIHMHTLLMHGPPVTLPLLQHLFTLFPSTHAILHLAATNFVAAHCTLFYSCDEFTEIRRWYRQSVDRRAVFAKAEAINPEFGKMPQTDIEVWRIDSFAAERARKAKEVAAMMEKENKESREVVRRRSGSGDGLRTVRRGGKRMLREGKQSEDMSAKLTEALKKVQAEREAEEAEEEMIEEAEEMGYFQPESYKAIGEDE